MTQTLFYGQAVQRALYERMEGDPKILVFGIGVDDHKGTFGSTAGLVEKFGKDRVFDTPLAEQACTGAAIGLALQGFHPVHVHLRMDFMFLAMDQLFNLAAKWMYMFGGTMHVPMVIKTTIGRSWGQGAQHSQSLQAMFAHIPGLKVVMPSTPGDAKGMMHRALDDQGPVIFIEHRMLYYLKEEVSSEQYRTPFGSAAVRLPGSDVTIVGTSYTTIEALEAASYLSERGIHVEVIDLRSIVPLDLKTVLDSVEKTRRLVVIDTGHLFCGIGAEILASVAERGDRLIEPPRRLGLPAAPTPTTQALEKVFYPDTNSIIEACYDIMHTPNAMRDYPLSVPTKQIIENFRGPF